MDMSALHRTLPTLEELQFRQAVQCTTYLNTGHLAIECSLRTYCTICHSKLHSVEQCEYNLLNKTVVPVRQIFPENGYQNHRNIFTYGYQENVQQENFHQNQDFSGAQNTNQQKQSGGRFKQNRYKNKKSISQKPHDNFNNLQILMGMKVNSLCKAKEMEIINLCRVKEVERLFLLAIFAGKVVIMQFSVPLKEEDRWLIWLC